MTVHLVCGLVVFSGLMCGQVATITSISGIWVNPVIASPNALTGENTPNIRWGSPVSGNQKSGYDFDAASTPISAFDETWVKIGTFTHLNFPVFPPAITGVDLKLTLGFEAPPGGAAQSEVFTYSLTHEETPNSSPCPSFQISSTPCDDRVTILGQVAPTTFQLTIGSDVYTYTVDLSFGAPGGQAPVFITEEGRSNTADIFAKFTQNIQPIPEPGFYGVLAIGLSGLFLAYRRRSHR